jgi:hypothetical protein
MNKFGTKFGAETARRIAADPAVVSSEIGSLATEWVALMDTEPSLKGQHAATAAYYHRVIPADATPMSILRGDHGKEAQLAFLDGALLAAEQLIAVRLEDSASNE